MNRWNFPLLTPPISPPIFFSLLFTVKWEMLEMKWSEERKEKRGGEGERDKDIMTTILCLLCLSLYCISLTSLPQSFVVVKEYLFDHKRCWDIRIDRIRRTRRIWIYIPFNAPSFVYGEGVKGGGGVVEGGRWSQSIVSQLKGGMRSR